MDLTTHYMGLQLKNPLVASASPLSADLGNIRHLEDSGAAAIVLPSIFEEQIEADALHETGPQWALKTRPTRAAIFLNPISVRRNNIST
jgi:hypothetical protein